MSEQTTTTSTALELMTRMESGARFAPDRKAWESACHDEARSLPWIERSVFAWACDCPRCKRGTLKGGEYIPRPGDVNRLGEPIGVQS